MGRKTKRRLFLQNQTSPHAPLTSRCTSKDKKAAKKLSRLVRDNHRIVMKFMGQINTKRLDKHLRQLFETCRGRQELQDELFLVIMKQCRGDLKKHPNIHAHAFKLLGLLFKVSCCSLCTDAWGAPTPTAYSYILCPLVN